VDSRGGVLPLRLSTGLSSVADGMVRSAAPLLAASLTSDPRAVATVTMASLAAWLTGPVSGALTDRLPRRAVLVWTGLARGAYLVVFAALVVTERASVALVAVTAFLMTAGTAFSDAAAQAVLPRLVGRDVSTLSRQNGRLHMVETTGRSLVGLPLGPLLFAWAAALPFALSSAALCVAAQAIRRLPRVAADTTHRRSLHTEIWAGLVYLVRDRLLLTMSLFTGVLNFADAVAMAVFVLFAEAELGVSAAGYGLLLLGLAVGNVLGGALAGRFARCRWSVTMLVSGVVHALGWAAIAAVASPWLAAAVLPLMGIGQTVVTVSIVSTRQAMVPDQLLGRVIAGFRLIGNGSAVLGAAAGGFLAAAFGLSSTPWAAAALCLGVVLALLWIVRSSH
jgi:MFS family permease